MHSTSSEILAETRIINVHFFKIKLWAILHALDEDKCLMEKTTSTSAAHPPHRSLDFVLKTEIGSIGQYPATFNSKLTVQQ